MENFKKTILSIGKTINYKNNDIIFNEHDQCNSIGFIIKGKIKEDFINIITIFFF